MYSGKAAEIANKYGLSHQQQQQQQQQNGGAGSPVSSGGSGSPQPIPKIIVTTASMKRRPYQDYY
jgi:hypothetical protein